MYIPKSKYSTPKHTPGDEFTLDGRNYIGWYIQLSTGEYYTGRSFNASSKKLISSTETTELKPYLSFIPVNVSPTPRDKTNLKWTRYFLQDQRNKRIIEVDKAKFDSFKIKNYITRGTLEWELKGPAENLNVDGYLYYGAAHQNKLKAEKLEKTIPGITSFIKDYSQFVE